MKDFNSPFCNGNISSTLGLLLKRSLANVEQNCVLSHFHFVERFCVNTVYREQLHESMWRKQENHLSSQNNNFKEELWRSKDFLNRGLR